MGDEFELEMSPLSQEVTESGRSVDVQIYRGGDSDWILEAVDEHGTSTVWDDQFATDADALNELRATIAEEGIEALIDDPS